MFVSKTPRGSNSQHSPPVREDRFCVAFIIQNDVTTSRAIPQKTSLAGRTNGISSRLFCMGDRRDS